jgi:signal peptidase I
MAYRLGPVRRGDVVVFHVQGGAPGAPKLSYIKRVIAVGGDVVRVDHGTVFVNGTALAEPYVPERFRDERSMEAMAVPAGELFVMGDHRTISSDSREFGPVAAAAVYGKAQFVYWPVAELGTVR